MIIILLSLKALLETRGGMPSIQHPDQMPCDNVRFRKSGSCSMSIRIVCQDGSEVMVPNMFREKMSLFQNPDIIRDGSYNLQCRASVRSLNLLLRRVYDESAQVEITANNVDELRALAQELGFTGIDQELRAFVTGGAQEEESDMRRELLELRERTVRQDRVVMEMHRQLNELVRERRTTQQTLQQFRSLEERLRTVERAYEEQTRRNEDLTREIAQLKETMRGQTMQIDTLSGKEFLFDGVSPWNGVISYLTRKYGGNVNDRGVVKVFGSEAARMDYTRYHPKNVADLTDMNSYFLSDDAPEPWVGYNFQELRVIPTSYSVTYIEPIFGRPRLPALQFQVSNDLKSWRTLDSRDRKELKRQPPNFRICPVPTERFQYVRIKVPARVGNCQICITAFEVYGTLFEP